MQLLEDDICSLSTVNILEASDVEERVGQSLMFKIEWGNTMKPLGHVSGSSGCFFMTAMAWII